MDWGSTRPLDVLDDPAAARLFAGARASVGASHANSYPPVRARICSATGTVSSIAPESCPSWAGIRKESGGTAAGAQSAGEIGGGRDARRARRIRLRLQGRTSAEDEQLGVAPRAPEGRAAAGARARSQANVRASPACAGVSFENRQDLLGHRSGRITTHYSAAELGHLIEAANRACAERSRKSPAPVMLKRQAASA